MTLGSHVTVLTLQEPPPRFSFHHRVLRMCSLPSSWSLSTAPLMAVRYGESETKRHLQGRSITCRLHKKWHKNHNICSKRFCLCVILWCKNHNMTQRQKRLEHIRWHLIFSEISFKQSRLSIHQKEFPVPEQVEQSPQVTRNLSHSQQQFLKISSYLITWNPTRQQTPPLVSRYLKQELKKLRWKYSVIQLSLSALGYRITQECQHLKFIWHVQMTVN
jgi:hypothetical protein